MRWFRFNKWIFVLGFPSALFGLTFWVIEGLAIMFLLENPRFMQRPNLLSQDIFFEIAISIRNAEAVNFLPVVLSGIHFLLAAFLIKRSKCESEMMFRFLAVMCVSLSITIFVLIYALFILAISKYSFVGMSELSQ